MAAVAASFSRRASSCVADRAAVGPRGEPTKNLLGGRLGRQFLSRRDEEDAAMRVRVTAGLLPGLSAAIAFAAICSAASRYFSISSGGSVSTSPMLSNP